MIMKNPQTNLPPGFRFHPTDEELILHYLRKKVTSLPVPVSIIADVDIYKYDPWDLPDKAPFGEKEWYFFSPRDRKYPNGARPNRAAASGYWKATGTDKIIAANIGRGGGKENVGVKKALVFYTGKPPKGIKSNWIMHEYRLAETLASNRSNNTVANERRFKSKESSMRLDDWVLCRIYKKTQASASSPTMNGVTSDQEQEEEEQFIPQENAFSNRITCDPPAVFNSTLKPQKSCSFSNLLEAADFSILSSFLSENPSNQTGFEFPSMINCSNPDQPFFSNYDNYSNGYLDQKLPQLSSSSPDKAENDLKRKRWELGEDLMNPSKKILSSCGYNNGFDQSDHSMAHQYSFLNQSFLNQQFLLSPHLQFQG